MKETHITMNFYEHYTGRSLSTATLVKNLRISLEQRFTAFHVLADGK